MDNGSMDKDQTGKLEEILLCAAAFAGLLFMVIYWR